MVDAWPEFAQRIDVPLTRIALVLSPPIGRELIIEAHHDRVASHLGKDARGSN